MNASKVCPCWWGLNECNEERMQDKSVEEALCSERVMFTEEVQSGEQ